MSVCMLHTHTHTGGPPPDPAVHDGIAPRYELVVPLVRPTKPPYNHVYGHMVACGAMLDCTATLHAMSLVVVPLVGPCVLKFEHS